MRAQSSILFATFLALIPLFARADEAQDSSDWKLPKHAPTPNQASDASFDIRLPPVLPGEEVSDGEKKIKVWSTAGPVPVGRAPEPWKERRQDPLNVIIDGRSPATETRPLARGVPDTVVEGTQGDSPTVDTPESHSP